MGFDVNVERAGHRPMYRNAFAAAKRRLVSSSFLRHNTLLFVANIATSISSFLYHPVVGHLLGESGYGTAVSLGGLFAVLLIPTQVVTYLFNKFAADLSAQGRLDQVNYLLRKGTVLALALGVLAVVICIALSSSIAGFYKLSSLEPVIIVSLGVIIAFAYPLNLGVLQGRQQFAWFALCNFLNSILRVALAAILLLAHFGLSGALLASVLTSFVVYLLTFLPLRDVLRGPQKAIPSLKPLLTYSIGAVLALSGGVLLTNIDTILAKHYFTADMAGYYAALVTMGRTVLFIGGSFVLVMFPKVAALHQQGRPHGALLGWTMAGVFVLSTSALVVFWLFPGQVINLIFHVPPQVTPHLVWYGLSMLLYALSSVLTYYFLSIGKMAFVPFLLACCALQVVLLAIWHQNIGQFVTVMDVVMAILLCSMVALYGVQRSRVDLSSDARKVAV